MTTPPANPASPFALIDNLARCKKALRLALELIEAIPPGMADEGAVAFTLALIRAALGETSAANESA